MLSIGKLLKPYLLIKKEIVFIRIWSINQKWNSKPGYLRVCRDCECFDYKLLN